MSCPTELSLKERKDGYCYARKLPGNGKWSGSWCARCKPLDASDLKLLNQKLVRTKFICRLVKIITALAWSIQAKKQPHCTGRSGSSILLHLFGSPYCDEAEKNSLLGSSKEKFVTDDEANMMCLDRSVLHILFHEYEKNTSCHFTFRSILIFAQQDSYHREYIHGRDLRRKLSEIF